MSESRTLVCSVLFLDIESYSRHGVAQQVRLKNAFNEMLGSSLQDVQPQERVVIDTGDGAAIAFLGDPEAALFAALGIFDNVGELPVRMGINLGPVYLTKDINGQNNVIGDGINVAQRIMSFAQAGELLVSRSFYEVVLRLSAEYATLFQPQPARADKHNRTHELYCVSQAVRIGRRVAEAQTRLRAKRSPLPALSEAPARISDAGSHFIVSGGTRQSVEVLLERLAAEGGKLLSPPALVGSRWIATCENRRGGARVTVEQFGLKSIVSGPTRESVEAKLRELRQFGASVVQELECVDGVWTAVCEKH